MTNSKQFTFSFSLILVFYAFYASYSQNSSCIQTRDSISQMLIVEKPEVKAHPLHGNAELLKGLEKV